MQMIPNGEYKVKMLNGVMMLLNIFGDRKIIKGTRGHNVCMGIKWGQFDVQEKDGYIELIYEKGKIIDKIKRVNNGLYSGEFYWRGRFLGHFELRKV